MIIFKRPADIHSYTTLKKAAQGSIGFVPTMGALHQGHISLINAALHENQLVVCSIFVNPTQFNDPADFEKYPSTIEQDIVLLEKTGCHVLFLPSVSDMYPDGVEAKRHYDLGALEHVLEGKFRPGHFQGVCQVVNRLLEVVAPTNLYLGQKDFQQCMVIKEMIRATGLSTILIIRETLREPDGLAMSSRNLRLNPDERKQAAAINQTLRMVKENIKPGNLSNLMTNARRTLMAKGFRVDYLEVAEASSLEIVKNWDGVTPIVVLTAAFLNNVRLIDNLLL